MPCTKRNKKRDKEMPTSNHRIRNNGEKNKSNGKQQGSYHRRCRFSRIALGSLFVESGL